MVLSVGGRLFREPGSLSERSQLVLSLIPSGPEWLVWAISDRSAHFAFPDEEALLTELPNLHGSALVLLPALGLLARPAQLITLEIDALNDLLAAENTRTEEALAKARTVLAGLGLLTQNDLVAGWAMLTRLGVAGAPVFQVMDYPAHEAVMALVEVVNRVDVGLAREAAAFALTVSSSPAEFADHVEIYVTLADKGEAPAARAARITAVLRALKARLFGYLGALQVTESNAAPVVGLAVSQLMMRGGFLGFTRLSLAAREVVAVGKPMEPGAVDAAVRACVEPVPSLLASNLWPMKPGLLRQDGAVEFPIEDQGRRLLILLDAGGTVSLDRARFAA